MNFLKYIQSQFQRVLILDTEYLSDSTGTIPEKVLCLVYKDAFTNETFRFWEYDKNNYQCPFDLDECLIVCYSATAEVGSLLSLLHGRPNNIWDSLVETARLYKPMRSGKGELKLLSTAEKYGIKDKLTQAEKDHNLDLILRRNEFSNRPFKYSVEEQKQILDYCQSDVDVLHQVFIKQVFDIENKMQLKSTEDFDRELWQIQNRGYAVGCVALVEKNGIPIDLNLVNKFNDNWVKVRDNLVREVNKEIDVFNEDLTFSFAKFNKLVIRNGLDLKWPRMKSGNFTTQSKILKRYMDNEEVEKFYELKKLSNMTKLTNYKPSSDGRTRCNLNPFGTVTSRCSPSSAKFVFGASKWARNFIKPPIGSWLVYIDYKSQEPAIMGHLSGDRNKIDAYRSGDIYIHTAKLFGKVPQEATPETHPEMRETFKTIDLANNFGQGPGAVAAELKCSVSHAKFLMKKYREVFKDYFKWIDGVIEHGLNQKYFSTVYGWQRHVSDLWTEKNGKRKHIHKSLLNWPIQSHGAEILRTALMDLTDKNFKVVALIHDAIMLEIPIHDFYEDLERAKQIMVDASIKVVGGPIQVEEEIIKTNYVQKKKKHQKLFDQIMGEIERYTQSGNEVHPE